MTTVKLTKGPQARVIHSHTLNPDYWSTYALTSEDVEFLYAWILESGRPKSARELAIALIQHHIDRERSALRQRFAELKVYQPKHTYHIGDKLIFPSLRMMSGEVIGVREGHHPEVGDFEVIRVQLSDGSTREFASRYPYPHRLNDADLTTLIGGAEAHTAEEIFDKNSEHLTIAINEALSKQPEFLRIGEEWFLRGMMAEVNIGHLNLAEAVLDMANGGPLTTDVILRDLGLPADVSSDIQEASLNSALSQDERFDNVSINDRPAWFLRRLEPLEILSTPSILQPVFHDTSEISLSDELEQWVSSLDDEWTWQPEMEQSAEAESATIILTFPHRVAGTLGWSRRLAAVLPRVRKPRVPLRFRDRSNGHEMLVWLVRDGRYLWGLGRWYHTHDLPPGTYIEVSRDDEEEGVFWISAPRRRARREWVRLATLRDGHLRLETAQRPVSCELDELMSVFVDNPQQFAESRDGYVRSVSRAVREAFPEIAKLSPQGNVHIRTLYAVVNVLVRATPRDILHVLISSNTYVPVSDGYWHLSNS